MGSDSVAQPWVVFLPDGVDVERVELALTALTSPAGVLIVPYSERIWPAVDITLAVNALLDDKKFTRWQQRLDKPDIWPSQATREHLARYLRETLR